MQVLDQIFGVDGFDPADYTRVEMVNPREAMLSAIRAFGIQMKTPPGQGVINRYPDKDDSFTKKSAWVWYTTFQGEYGEIYIARFGSWRRPDETVEWCSARSDQMSRTELRQLNEQMEAARRVAELEKKKEADRVIAELLNVYPSLPQATEHPYLTSKGIKSPLGVKLDRDRLLIPIINLDGVMTSCQYIFPTGQKRFKTGGAIKGGFFRIEGSDDIVLCEGMATGATIHEATGMTVVIAFNAGNLMEVARGITPRGRFIIAADDDRFTQTGNTGVIKAQAASEAVGAEMLMPCFRKTDIDGTDFNDMAGATGIESVKAVFLNQRPELKIVPLAAVPDIKPVYTPDFQENTDVPPGVINEIYKYYMATSGFDQKGFALNTALSIASVILGRNFQTDEEPGNRASLFFINVGNTSTGKEHVKTVIERVLKAADLPLVMGDGFTSSGAVFSALLTKPRFISVIDELGIYLEAQRQKNLNQIEANSTLMQCFSRTHSVLRPKNYSSMTIGKKQREDIENREVENPAVTLVGMTTPSTFFSAISSKDIHSGFINRFIIHISNLPIMPRKRCFQMDVPESIISWVNAIKDRYNLAGNNIELASKEANVVTISFSQAARDLQEAFGIEVAKKQNQLLEEQLESLGGRVVEISMRLSLIIALSRNPKTEIIADIDMKYAIDFMRERFSELVGMVNNHMRSGELDTDLMEMVDVIKGFGVNGANRSTLIKKGGVFRKYRSDHLDKVLQTLIDGEFIQKETTSTGGRPVVTFRAY